MQSFNSFIFVLSRYNAASLDDDFPDVQLFLASAADNADGGLYGKRGCGLGDDFFARLFEDILYQDSYAAVPLLLRPRSRGYIKLRSADPADPPVIVPNYFGDPHDLEVLVRTNKYISTCKISFVLLFNSSICTK